MFINIEIERVRHHMSKSSLAQVLSVNIPTLTDWILRRRPIPADKLRTLSQTFGGCSVDYLLKEA